METKEAVAALAALAQDTRLEIFRVLVKAGPQGLAAGSIAEALTVPPPTLSFHLKELRHARVVGRERRGRNLVYTANYTAMNALVKFLTEECCRGLGDSTGESA